MPSSTSSATLPHTPPLLECSNEIISISSDQDEIEIISIKSDPDEIENLFRNIDDAELYASPPPDQEEYDRNKLAADGGMISLLLKIGQFCIRGGKLLHTELLKTLPPVRPKLERSNPAISKIPCGITDSTIKPIQYSGSKTTLPRTVSRQSRLVFLRITSA